jgi:hypothetical protein
MSLLKKSSRLKIANERRHGLGKPMVLNGSPDSLDL